MSSFELLSDPKYGGEMKVLEKQMGMFHEERSKVLLFSRSTQVCISKRIYKTFEVEG